MEKYSPKPGEVKAYLEGKNIEYKERGNELMFACLNGCDDDDTESEKYHCSVNAETGLWHCFKCDQKGNFTQLKQLLGDSITQDKSSSKKPQTMPKKLITLAARCHQELMKPETGATKLFTSRERNFTVECKLQVTGLR